MDHVTSWIPPIAQSLIATLIYVALAHWFSARRASIQRVTGAAISAGKTMAPTMTRVLWDIVILWFLITQLRAVVEDPAPLTRMAVFEIAAWTWWLLLVAFDMAFGPLVPRRGAQ